MNLSQCMHAIFGSPPGPAEDRNMATSNPDWLELAEIQEGVGGGGWVRGSGY